MMQLHCDRWCDVFHTRGEGVHHEQSLHHARSVHHVPQGTDIIVKNLFCPVDKRGFLHGTPERTLTSDLPLRRRPLYPAELRMHILNIVPKKIRSVNEKTAHFLPATAYNGKMIAEGSEKYGKNRHLLGCRRLYLCRPSLATQWKIIYCFESVILNLSYLPSLHFSLFRI